MKLKFTMNGYDILTLTCQNSTVPEHHCHASCISSPWMAGSTKYILAHVLNVPFYQVMPRSVKKCADISVQLSVSITYSDQSISKDRYHGRNEKAKSFDGVTCLQFMARYFTW